jgi:hypothetical protein
MILRHARNRIARDFVDGSVTPGGREVRPMRIHGFFPPAVLTVLVGTLAFGLGSSPARAQSGFGVGFMGEFHYVPSPTDFSNSHALIQAGRGQLAPASFHPHANDANSFHSRLRDNGFVPSYDVRRRQPSANRSQPARSPAGAPRVAAAPTPAAPAPRQVPPLPSFFDSSVPQQLVWPSESPVAGILMKKRDLAGYTCLVVLEETKLHQVASIETVTFARQTLLDYGRPALEQLRMDAPASVVDRFHSFLLSLYDSLAQAASPQ